VQESGFDETPGLAPLHLRGEQAFAKTGETMPPYDFRVNGATQDANDLPTACVLCSHNCGLRVDVREGSLSAIRADPSNPFTAGYSCNKGYSIGKYIDHNQRVTEPQRRRPDGSFETISWDTAIAEIGTKLKQMRRNHGGQCLAIAGIGGQANHLDGPYASAFIKGFGSPWIFNALAQEKTQHPLVDKWIFGAPSSVYLHGESEQAAYTLVLGTNPVISHRGIQATRHFATLAKDPARRLVVVDPRHTETAQRADRHLAIRPGTDAQFLIAVIKILLDEQLGDPAFLARTDGVSSVQHAVHGACVAELATRCGLEKDEIYAVARNFAAAQSACIFWDLGVEQCRYSTLVAYLIRVVLVLTGNIGNPGGNRFLSTFLPHASPSRKPPPVAPESGIPALPMFGQLGYFSPNLMAEEILNTRDTRIRAVIVEGSNPMIQYADTQRVRAALEHLELLVVIEPAMSETAKLADYVLPTPVGYEKWEWALFPKGFPELYAHLRPPVVPVRGQGLPEAEIYARLAWATGIATPAPAALRWLAARKSPRVFATAFLGAVMALSKQTRKPANMLFWIYELLGPHLPAPPLAAVWALCHLVTRNRREDVTRGTGLTGSDTAIAEALFDRILAHPQGVVVGKVDEHRNLEDNLRHPDQRMKLAHTAMLAELSRALLDPMTPPPDYPMILQAGRRTRWNANTIHRDPSWRKGKQSGCRLYIHPNDAASHDLSPGDRVSVKSLAGEVVTDVELDSSQLPGHVSLPNGFGLTYIKPDGTEATDGICVNVLTSAHARDPFTGIPHHKWVPVRVSKVEEG